MPEKYEREGLFDTTKTALFRINTLINATLFLNMNHP